MGPQKAAFPKTDLLPSSSASSLVTPLSNKMSCLKRYLIYSGDAVYQCSADTTNRFICVLVIALILKDSNLISFIYAVQQDTQSVFNE